ncbi:RHS repeat-associated core domain-containing protein [Caulobacter soli]|uniref:RHS repeat-associated core domain-containing protein n=1 Tax=Caulobacter soli TaxID=2708539 RepID=UPI0013E9E680|nr:RHS repeat-associated core domain-containing protein [Caulobacter soli]
MTSSVGTASEAYGYDARGNLTSSGAKTYAYDIENRLISTSDGQLLYDPLGRLSAIIPVSGASVYFAYDDVDVVAEYGGIGLLLRRYVNGPGADDPIITYEGADLTQKRWLMSDAQGSIVSSSDATGAAQTPNSYDEYGIGSGNPGRFGYTGQMRMPELGDLYNYKARIYSPTLGRFLQTDPTGYGTGLN